MRRRVIVVAAVVLSMALGAELMTRAFADHLPEPAAWSTPELNYKQDQIDARARSGGVDVMIAGTSHSDAGFDPKLLEVRLGDGLRTYNASVGAASIRMVEVWTTAVAEVLDPAVAVVGLSSRELNPNDPRQSELEAEFFEAPAVEERLDTGDLLDRLDRVVSEWSYLVRYRRELRSPENLLGTEDPPWGARDTSEWGQYLRFVEGRYERSDRQRRFLQTGGLNEFEVGGAELTSLRRLVEKLVGHGIEVTVVGMPTTSDWISYHPGGATEHDAALDRAGDAVTRSGGSFIRIGVWPDELFADAIHLNGAGVMRLTEWLADLLGKRQNWK